MKVVKQYDTGERLEGTASAELVRQSNAVGAVSAYVDGLGVWHYVAPGDTARDPRRYFGREIVTVVVEDVVRAGRPEHRAAEPIGWTGAFGMPPRIAR